ncbi:MAG TPA: hypothetical protein VLC46_16480 [Thermoanaerobaculia bacterium]|jgi:hypothetical protein|nr:hypothetical protein [Thermoanaerobaculia bacterium]
MSKPPTADYLRARAVLLRLRHYNEEVVSAKAMLPSGMPRSSGAAFSALGRPETIRDWKLAVQASLREVGELGVAIMGARLLSQQKSQANSFVTIAACKAVRQINGQVMTPAACEAYFNLSLVIFIRQLNERQLPDDPFSQVVVPRQEPFIAIDAAHAVLAIAKQAGRSVTRWRGRGPRRGPAPTLAPITIGAV